MISLKDKKELTQDKPIREAGLPKEAVIPLSQHTGRISEAVVSVGEKVKVGQLIGKASGFISSNIHSSVLGVVKAIEERPHPVIGRCLSVIIQSDGLDEHLTPNTKHLAPNELSADEIRRIIFEAGIVGLGGAAFPTHVKLEPPKDKRIDSLILNGAECEPYLTCDYRLMIEKTEEIFQGIELVAKCLGASNVYIAIGDNKPQAIKAFNHKLQTTNYKPQILKSRYPQGGEKQLIKNILGKEVPRGGLPFDIGVVVHNIATCFAIYEAVYKNKPLYERVLTITGSCISNPQNVLARIGTPIKELIDFCGPLKEEAAKMIIGGPMMGIAQFTTDVPVIKSTTGVILFNDKEVKMLDEEFCIRCGACVRECPVGLMPCLINLASEKEMWQESKIYGALDCIECGLCDYVCPANRRSVQSIKIAKLALVK
jgi:electron transport complex protein RnfC